MNIFNIKTFTFKQKITRLTAVVVLAATILLLISANFITRNFISPLGNQASAIKRHEVFGFAPYWTIKKLDNVDWNVLTTLAYFGVPVLSDGSLDKENIGYTTIDSPQAQEVFEKARSHGTKVVLTVTQMTNSEIRALLDDDGAKRRSIEEIVSLVKKEGFDGVNVDYEYVGNPGQEYMDSFSEYIEDFSTTLHREVPGSSLTVSVYASAVRDPKIYDIAKISKSSDAIFMMAYDFATSASDAVIPTSPLYGHKEGKYWYDVSSAVDDFLQVMPAEKLILGLPWYGYDYPVAEPGVKVDKYQGYSYYYWWRGRRYIGYSAPNPAKAQTYAVATSNSTEATGWDDAGKVGWKAYKEDGVWRMIFIEDEKSLRIKYNFAKDKKLAGVGIWALGFDSGTTEMWSLLSSEFGRELALAQ